MEARRQQVASAAVAAAAAGDVNLPSGLLADFEFSVSLVSAELKEFDEEEKAGEPLGYRSTIRNFRMRGWPLDGLPKHMVEWRANLPLPAVARWSEEGERRSLEHARGKQLGCSSNLRNALENSRGLFSALCAAHRCACVALLGAPWGESGVSKNMEQGSGGGVVGLNLKSKAGWQLFQCRPGGTSTPPLQTVTI